MDPTPTTGGFGGAGGGGGDTGGAAAAGGAGGSAAAGGVAGTGGSGGDGGGGFVCVADECPGIDTTCRYRVCLQNACDFENAPEATVCTEGGGQICDDQGACVECLTEQQCSGTELCDNQQCVPTECGNGSLDPGETDIDCGGPTCSPCDNGLDCLVPEDCQSLYCNGGTCAACSTDNHCAAVQDTWCDDTANGGTCVDKKPIPAACSADAECLSDHCSPDDDVCCDADCESTCEACLIGKTGSPNGTCDYVTANRDYDVECGLQPPASCGSTGAGCTGSSNSCILYGSTTQCIAPTCTNGQETTAGMCNGSGTCVAGQTNDCGEYVCDATACRTTCSSHGHCSGSNICDSLTSTCMAPKSLGAACGDGSECSSGNCPTQDGVCCNLACSGSCEACTAAATCGTDGTCLPAIPGTNPNGECTTGNCFDGSCQTGTVAFVTSSAYSGNLGGLSGAQSICQNHATAACLPGTYLPWLSTPTASPSTVFNQQTVPYRLVDGTQIADNWTDLTNGDVDANLNLDELGAAPPSTTEVCTTPDTVSWTGTMPDGSLYTPSGTDPPGHCNSWTSTTDEASWGRHSASDHEWSIFCYGTSGGTCSQEAALYCFQQ